jgi:hypothetical protein
MPYDSARAAKVKLDLGVDSRSGGSPIPVVAGLLSTLFVLGFVAFCMLGVAGVLEHAAAGFLAVSAFLRASSHVLVVGELLALLGAFGACVRARLTDQADSRRPIMVNSPE